MIGDGPPPEACPLVGVVLTYGCGGGIGYTTFCGTASSGAGNMVAKKAAVSSAEKPWSKSSPSKLMPPRSKLSAGWSTRGCLSPCGVVLRGDTEGLGGTSRDVDLRLRFSLEVTSLARRSTSFRSSLSLREPGQTGSRAWRALRHSSTCVATASMTTWSRAWTSHRRRMTAEDQRY